ncbi:hypothetical protein BC826DRAFT_461523 [Russula brevipes]|nr:hypothetical protein BC826DRAFT_461523 [Russula brevipes]
MTWTPTIMELLDFPEEILVLILKSAIPPPDPRISLPRPEFLLTCRTLHRIGLPFLYHTLLIKSPTKAALVHRTLLEQPTLVRHVRHLYSRVTTLSLLLVLRAIGHGKGSLQTLDFSINAPWMSGRPDGSDEDEPLTAVPVRNLAVRHGNVMFLRHSVFEVTGALAEAIQRWPNLVTRSWRSNPAYCSPLCHLGGRIPSPLRCPVRPRCGSYARPFPRCGTPLCSSRARTPACNA